MSVPRRTFYRATDAGAARHAADASLLAEIERIAGESPAYGIAGARTSPDATAPR
jgi:hypothetical protein